MSCEEYFLNRPIIETDSEDETNEPFYGN